MTNPYILHVREGQVIHETDDGPFTLVLNNCTFIVCETPSQADAVLKAKVELESLLRIARPCDVCKNPVGYDFRCCEFGPLPEDILKEFLAAAQQSLDKYKALFQ